MKYKFIDRHRSAFRVTKMCQVLEVSRSAYYAWKRRPESVTEQRNKRLLEHIREIYHQSRRLYGSPRITAQLHLRTGAPIVMFFCVPEGDRYRFVIEPLEVEAGCADGDDAVEQLTAAATRQIERHIRQCPEAWLWIHDRWRTRPPETTDETGDP